MKELGFTHQELAIIPGRKGGLKKINEFKKRIGTYHETRDLLDSTATSGLSPYLRHGLISIREVLSLGIENNKVVHQTFVSEIVWREFYQMILFQFLR